MKGIIFKPDMIKAIVEGRKTITRRLEGLREINHEPDIWVYRYFENGYSVFEGIGLEIWARAKPRYQVGEVVYIKEAWAAFLRLDFVGDKTGFRVQYKLDNTVEDKYCTVEQAEKLKVRRGTAWDSPLFMLEWAARYFIQITDVRVERLQEITPDDCVKEGLLTEFHDGDLDGQMLVYVDLRGQYQALWDSINPKCPWANNPWCFVYTFQLVDKKK